MILAVYLEDMSPTIGGFMYESIIDFAYNKFDIKISNEGYVSIDGRESDISYKMKGVDNDSNGYSKIEAKRDFINSDFFKAHIKSHHWTLYKTTRIN